MEGSETEIMREVRRNDDDEENEKEKEKENKGDSWCVKEMQLNVERNRRKHWRSRRRREQWRRKEELGVKHTKNINKKDNNGK